MVSGAARSPTLSSRAHATPRARSPTCPPRNRQATARKQRENANRGGHKASGQSGNSTHAGQSKKVLKRTKRTARALDSHPKKNAGACYEHAPAPKKTKDPRGGARPQRPSKKGRRNLLPRRGVQDRSGAEKKVNKKHKVRGAGKTVITKRGDDDDSKTERKRKGRQNRAGNVFQKCKSFYVREHCARDPSAVKILDRAIAIAHHLARDVASSYQYVYE